MRTFGLHLDRTGIVGGGRLRQNTGMQPSKVISINAARAPAGAVNLPHDIGHLAAQAELDAALFPHYLLGRQLALEEVVREMLLALPAKTRAGIVDRLSFNADLAMQKLTQGIADPKDEAATCGHIATLIQQGM